MPSCRGLIWYVARSLSFSLSLSLSFSLSLSHSFSLSRSLTLSSLSPSLSLTPSLSLIYDHIVITYGYVIIIQQVFILLDKPDEETDSILSEHVMALHAGPTNKRRRSVTHLSTQSLAYIYMYTCTRINLAPFPGLRRASLPPPPHEGLGTRLGSAEPPW